MYFLVNIIIYGSFNCIITYMFCDIPPEVTHDISQQYFLYACSYYVDLVLFHCVQWGILHVYIFKGVFSFHYCLNQNNMHMHTENLSIVISYYSLLCRGAGHPYIQYGCLLTFQTGLIAIVERGRNFIEPMVQGKGTTNDTTTITLLDHCCPDEIPLPWQMLLSNLKEIGSSDYECPALHISFAVWYYGMASTIIWLLLAWFCTKLTAAA